MQVKTLVTWFYQLLRLLVVVPSVGLAAGGVTLFLRGLFSVRENFGEVFCVVESTGDGIREACRRMGDLPFEAHILEGVNLLLLGTGCLVLAIDLLDMFVHRLFPPGPMRVNSFHALKSRFGNFIVLAMAISFLQAFGTTSAMKSSVKTPVAIIGSPMLISAVSIAVVTLVLIAFGRWGGEQSSQR